MRFFGVLQMSSGWIIDDLNVPGGLNDIVDAVSRRKHSEIHANFSRVCLDIPWHVWELGANGRAQCTSVLASSSSETPLRHRLCTLTKGVSVRGRSFL